MPGGFYLALGSRSAGRSFTYEKWSFLGIFSCLNPFLQFFRQVKGWLLLKSLEMIRMSHVVECRLVFRFLCNLGWLERVLKLLKNAQLNILSRLGTFTKFLGRLRSGLDQKLHEMMSVTCSCVYNCFSFVLWGRLTGRSVQSYEKWLFFSVFSRLRPFHQVLRQV